MNNIHDFFILDKPNQFTANIKVTEINRYVLIYSITVFLITSDRNTKRLNFIDLEIFITDFDITKREESGSTTSSILLCSAGEKDDVTSAVTLAASVMLYLLLRANIKGKKKVEYKERIRKKYKINLDLKARHLLNQAI